MTAVVFAGLGAIGLPMAKQLMANGLDVVGVDPVEDARRRAETSGFRTFESIRKAPRSGVVIAMVATPEQLATLVAEAGDNVRGQLWIVMSTVGPDALKEQAAILADRGARIVDAPVTGGVARAKTAELVIFASGETADLDDAMATLSHFGAVRRVGTHVGDGQAVKVVNQHLCSIHIVAAAEALSLAASLGLDQADVLDLVGAGAAGSWMLSDRGPRMLQGSDVEVTSAINIFVKDSQLVARAAESQGAAVPLLQVARDRYARAAEMGLGKRDDSRVIETYD